MTGTFESRMRGPWHVGADAVSQRLWQQLIPYQADRERYADFLNALAAGSPYLAGLIKADPDHAIEIFRGVPETLRDELLTQVKEIGRGADARLAASALRRTKSKFALLVACADLARVWSLDDVTQALTDFADACVTASVNVLLREQAEAGKFSLSDPENPAHNSGYVVLAMGKHGAGELNYSSDIDLVVFYDPATAPLAQDVEPAKFFVKLTQRMAALLQDITEEGYVFRVDLRLRPDPGATQVAIAIESAAIYYENMGQNWERAAFIKARPCAGDLALGDEFLARLRPYIWRKYLDFAAIADVQSLIRQIHSVKGHGEIAVDGHNLKLGRGGIREIEFFVQTQQLIAGGRNTKLRGRRTVDMLHALAEAKWLSPEAAEKLSACYRELRRLEHRAQMQDDAQTHLVPNGPEAIERYARFSGYESADALRKALRHILETVRDHSAKLFEGAEQLGGDSGSLVFTGGEDDPETIATLQRMGFRQASDVSATIRAWHFGRYAATRDRRAREALTELMPKLLQALTVGGDADRAFREFDAFLKGLPAGVQLFAMLRANPDLLSLIAQILSTAPRLSERLSRQPRILEAVLEPGFFGDLPRRDDLYAMLAAAAPPGLSLDDVMDRARVFWREQHFRIGVRVLSETVSAEAAGLSFANLADVVLTRLLAATREAIAEAHGTVEGGAVAVIAMGKLGGQEMTAASDLDLILVYDHAAEATQSDGRKPLSVQQYFARLTQRFIAAASAPTAEGSLYEVDMRLRPSGSKGPVATSLSSFEAYHQDSAWTWEKLALTRARVVAGDTDLTARLEHLIAANLTMSREVEAVRKDVCAMRGLMLREHKPSSIWDIKRMRGGLVEVEFVVQYLQLVHGFAHREVLSTTTLTAIQRLLAAGIISKADATALIEANQLYHRLTQLLRLCLEADYDPSTALPGLNRAVAQAAGAPDIKSTEALLQEHQTRIADLFDRLVGPPEK